MSSVIINGGGIIGLVLALALSKLTRGCLEISLIERYSLNPCDIELFIKNPRIIALSRGAYFELLNIGMYSILSSCSTLINSIEISEHNKFNKIFIHARDYKISELGYVIKLNIFRNQLFNLLRKQSSITMYYPTTIKYIIRKRYCNTIILKNGQEISAKLIIAADGSCSTLGSNCGIQWCSWDYQQIAVVVEIVTEFFHFGQAFERFTIFGPLALLPISDNVSFLIWCIFSKNKKEVEQWDNNRFLKELQKIFGWKLGKILNVGKRYFYDLWLTYANRHISHRLALVGNAAQKLHPIAGQGFNFGLRDVMILTKIITQALHSNTDIGSYSVLHLYQQRRRIDQYKIIMATDGLVRLFSNHYFPLMIARNIGLFCMSYSSFLQRILINTILSWKLD